MERQNSNELAHYGVLGMKWGIHRAAKKGNTYTYKSHGQKKYEKRVGKLNKKISKASSKQKNTQKYEQKLATSKTKLDKYKSRDIGRQKYAETTTVGRTVIKGMMLGPIGSGNYNRLRAAGYGRMTSVAGSALVSLVLPPGISALATREMEYINSPKK